MSECFFKPVADANIGTFFPEGPPSVVAHGEQSQLLNRFAVLSRRNEWGFQWGAEVTLKVGLFLGWKWAKDFFCVFFIGPQEIRKLELSKVAGNMTLFS